MALVSAMDGYERGVAPGSQTGCRVALEHLFPVGIVYWSR